MERVSHKVRHSVRNGSRRANGFEDGDREGHDLKYVGDEVQKEDDDDFPPALLEQATHLPYAD